MSQNKILDQGAVSFISKLHDQFESRRKEILSNRQILQKKINEGHTPDFLVQTKNIRDSDWQVSNTPKELLDRRVEITGPVDRKMIINALNSGAKVFMADFEDAHSPAWESTLEGHQNIYDAVRKTITFESPGRKKYQLNDKTAVLMIRPRGWHLPENNFKFNGAAGSGSLFDFGIFAYQNANELLKRGSGPYVYLPKLENHLEARLWNDVIAFTEKELGLKHGSFKATVLIETVLAAFEMDEIIYELKDYIIALNCGRWDYIFSFIKKFHARKEFQFPDRSQITMTTHGFKSYCELLIGTCHRRGVHAMGGMAAQIPIKNDLKRNEEAQEKVRLDKEREASLGHDGTWISHPGLLQVAETAFNNKMKTANQLDKKLDYSKITASDLLTIPKGKITEHGLKENIQVSLVYFEAWLRGIGCLPINDLMEDAATAEIGRSQVWHWIRHDYGKLESGEKITLEMVKHILSDQVEIFKKLQLNEDVKNSKIDLAQKLLLEIFESADFTDFLTLKGYEYL